MQPVWVAFIYKYVYNIVRGDDMASYTALIIDLKRSRDYLIEDRNSIQNYIFTVIQNLNKVFSNTLARDVEFSAGDDVQGLFCSPQSAYLYFRMFNMLVSPVEIRAGIGIGEWNVKIENASTAAQDGPAYHNARYAIKNVEDALGYSVLIYSKSEVDLFLNAVINTSSALTNNHSEYQNELMLLSELFYPVDYKRIIDKFELKLIFKILRLKTHLNFYTYFKKRKSENKYPFDVIDFMKIEPFPIDAADDDSTFYISSGRKRGMAGQISELLGISRQSIDKTLKIANIFEERNSTIVALKFMNKYLSNL